jgi:hypothetical protein
VSCPLKVIDFNSLNNELYALKVLIELVNKYMDDTDKLAYISLFSSTQGSIPGRSVAGAFADKKLSFDDGRVIQQIVSIYG